MGEGQRCQTCKVGSRPLCSVLSSIEELQPSRDTMLRRLPQGRMLLSGHRPTNWFGIIVSGVVKLMLNDPNGRQQIVGLQFPGDFIGATQSNPSPLIAEAATRVEICCFPRNMFDTLVGRVPELGRTMLMHTLGELDTARQWMVVLGNKSALERVATFLLLLEQKTRPCDATEGPGVRQEIIELPLSRTELAEYLSLSIETVSRQLKQLRSMEAIETMGRRKVRILDWATLNRLAAHEFA